MYERRPLYTTNTTLKKSVRCLSADVAERNPLCIRSADSETLGGSSLRLGTWKKEEAEMSVFEASNSRKAG